MGKDFEGAIQPLERQNPVGISVYIILSAYFQQYSVRWKYELRAFPLTNFWIRNASSFIHALSC